MIKISIIIPVYNSAYILETIESIINQTYKNYEIIVIDDGSSIDIPKIISKYMDKIIYLRQENSGISNARNKGISISKGDWIAILDHDDTWSPDKLERQIKLIEDDTSLGLVYSNADIINKDGYIIKKYFDECKPYKGMVFKEYFCNNFTPASTVMISKKVLNDVGLSSPNYKMIPDYELFSRVIRKYKIDFVDVPLAKIRKHDTNVTNNIKKCYLEVIEMLNEWLKKEPSLYKIIGKRKINNRLNSLNYGYAKIFYFEDNFKYARTILHGYMKSNPFYFDYYLLYILSFFGKSVKSTINKIKGFKVKEHIKTDKYGFSQLN